jgi:hypothetical protein
MTLKHRELNEIMEFDQVIAVVEGDIVLMNSIYCMAWIDEKGEFGYDAPDGWIPLKGFSGQSSSAGRYMGACMHESEYIGGGMEDYILNNDGLYVAVIILTLPDEEDSEQEVAGWCVLHRPA